MFGARRFQPVAGFVAAGGCLARVDLDELRADGDAQQESQALRRGREQAGQDLLGSPLGQASGLEAELIGLGPGEQAGQVIDDGGIGAADIIDIIDQAHAGRLIRLVCWQSLEVFVAGFVQGQGGDEVAGHIDETQQALANFVETFADEAAIVKRLGQALASDMRRFAGDLRPAQFADLAIEALELPDFHAALGADQQLQRGSGLVVQLVPGRFQLVRVQHGFFQLANERVIAQALGIDAPGFGQGWQHARVIIVQGGQEVFHAAGFPSPTRAA